MALSFLPGLRDEVGNLKLALTTAFGSEVELLSEEPRASEYEGCYERIAWIAKSEGFVELWLDKSSGHPQPLYWCGLAFESDYGWNKTGSETSQATQVRLFIDPDGKATVGYHSEADGDFNEDSFPDHSTFLEAIPPQFLDCTVSHAFPQNSIFYLGCFFTDYSPENAAAYLRALCSSKNEPWRFNEGAVTQRMTNVYERNPQARMRCVSKPGGLNCCVCGMNFLQRYGDIGRDFIHVHHVMPLSDRGGESSTSEGELVSVCPNCHAMLHRRGLRSPDELRALMSS